jgi:hypothetical protein
MLSKLLWRSAKQHFTALVRMFDKVIMAVTALRPLPMLERLDAARSMFNTIGLGVKAFGEIF